MNQVQNITGQTPQPEKPMSIPPASGKEMIDEAIRQARNDVQAILADAIKEKRPWPKTPENIKEMELTELIQRIEVLNNMEDGLLWEIELAESDKNRKKVVDLRGKKLDVNRLRRTFGEHIQMHEDAKDMIMTEDSPVSTKDKPGYVYMGQFDDQEFWIEEKEPSLQIPEKIAS